MPLLLFVSFSCSIILLLSNINSTDFQQKDKINLTYPFGSLAFETIFKMSNKFCSVNSSLYSAVKYATVQPWAGRNKAVWPYGAQMSLEIWNQRWKSYLKGDLRAASASQSERLEPHHRQITLCQLKPLTEKVCYNHASAV